MRGSLLLIFSSLAWVLFSQLWVQYNPTDDTYPHVYEQALDRGIFAVGGKAVLPAAFQHIPLAPHNWKLRRAGLMAIASVAEGAGKVI